MKKRGNGEGCIRQRKDGTWEGIFSAGYDPGTGKRIRKSIYGGTQAEVRKKLREACAAIDEGTYAEPSNLTVGEWLDIWLKDWIGNVKQYSTAVSYESRVRVNIKPTIGAIKLSALNPLQIQAMYKALMDGSGNSKKPLKPKSIKNINGILHKALDQALRLGYLRTNPCDAVTLPRVEKPEIKPLDDEQIPAFLKASKGDPFEMVYTFALYTGMRKSEILGLTWDRVSYADGTIRVDRQLIFEKDQNKRTYYHFASLKNDRERTITPPPQVFTLLQERHRIQCEDKRNAGADWINEEGLENLVFTNARGKHLSHVTVYKHFKAIAASIGLPDTRFHDTRHTSATASIRAGNDIKTVSHNLGHSTVAFTIDTYGHVTKQMEKDAAERMGRYFDTLLDPN